MKKEKLITGAPVASAKKILIVMVRIKDQALSLIALQRKPQKKFGFVDVKKQKIPPFVTEAIRFETKTYPPPLRNSDGMLFSAF